MVSHCNTCSEREFYADDLSKYIDVQIKGRCGNTDRQDCPKGDHTCVRHFIPNSKFYLAFENSYCKDYYSEKIAKATIYNVIPIVLGAANYTTFLPPHSYIDVEDYASAKDLAEYLHYLNRNHTEYLSYFWWQEHYLHLGMSQITNRVMCKICEKLHDPKLQPQVYEDVGVWYKSSCQGRGSFPWSRPEKAFMGCTRNFNYTFDAQGLFQDKVKNNYSLSISKTKI